MTLSPTAKRDLLFLNVGHFANHYLMLIFPTAVLAMAPAMGVAYGDLLALTTGAFIAFGVGTIPAGWLADRWSKEAMVGVYFIGAGLAAVLTGLTDGPVMLAVCLTLIGLFAAIYHPVGIALLADRAQPTGKVGLALGVNGVWGNLGVAGAGLATAWIADSFGWRAAFMAPGALVALIGLVWVMKVRKQPKPEKPHAKAAAQFAIDKWRLVAVLAIATAIGGLVFQITTIGLPKLFADRIGGGAQGVAIDLSDIGLLVGLVFSGAAVAQIVVGKLLDRMAIRPLFVAITLLQIPLLAMAATQEGMVLLISALVLMALVFGEIPLHDALVARYAKPAWRSRVFAVKYFGSFGVSSAAVPAIALMHGAGGIDGASVGGASVEGAGVGGFTTLFLVLAVSVPLITLSGLLLPGRDRAPEPVPAE
ncbi:MAG: MFS transporter [Alphaproteobacteria bacterium]|nr:MFS transporter [Alphaproteobacteria bacterium]